MHIRDVTCSPPGACPEGMEPDLDQIYGQRCQKDPHQGLGNTPPEEGTGRRRSRTGAKASWVPLMVPPKDNSRRGTTALSLASGGPGIEASWNYTLTKLSSLGNVFPWAVEPC